MSIITESNEGFVSGTTTGTYPYGTYPYGSSKPPCFEPNCNNCLYVRACKNAKYIVTCGTTTVNNGKCGCK